MTTDPLDPRATDADRLLRQERGEPVAIPIDGALRALQDVANTAVEHGASVPFAAHLLAAVDVLRLAIERAQEAEKARYPFHVVTTDPSLVRGPDGKLYSVHPCSHEECKAMGTTCDAEEVPEPFDTSGALADIAARVLALPHGGSPSVYLGSSAAAFDTLRVNNGTITQSPRKEERADLMCVLVVDGVEFYAIDRRPR